MTATGIKDQFLLDPNVTFLNHGSFGACPKPVFEIYQQWQLELERQPVEFLGRRFPDLLADARESIGSFLNAPADSLVFVANATWGVNAVVRSLEFDPGDEVLTTDQEYGACTMSWDWMLEKCGATLVKRPIPLPVGDRMATVDHFWEGVNEHTKAIFLSHITAPTALILPIKEICLRAREQGILTVIDGAHAPGQIPVDLTDLGADIYTGNFHKWLCAPKGAGFLYVRPEEQAWMESLIISWGWGRSGTISPSTFIERNEWQGTRDIAPFLSVPAAIAFQAENNWDDYRKQARAMHSELRTRTGELTGLEPLSPDDPEWFMQMMAFEIPVDDVKALTGKLYDQYRIEIPGVDWGGRSFLRCSFQAYNDHDDLDALMHALTTELA